MLTSWLLKSKDKQSSKDKQPLGKSFAIGCCNIGESILTNSATLLHKSQEKSRASSEPKNKSRVCNVLTCYGVHIKQVYLGSKEDSKSETVKKSEADTLQKTAPSLHVETHKSATAKDVVAENYAASKEDGWFPIQSRNVSGSTLVASPQAKSKTKVTNLSGLANILGKIVREETTVPALPHGKILSEDSTRKVKDERETTNNLRDTKPSMNSLQDEVRILNIKLEEKENVIRHLTTLREDTASLLDQQKLRNQTADSWIKVYMLLSIIAFNRMDIFERFQFFDTQVSRWLIAGAMQYISVGVFKPDCLAIENAAGDNGQTIDYHGLDSGEGDASSIDGQAGDAAHSEEEDTLSTEGQADDAAKNEREDASSTEGQVGDATAGQGEEQAGIEFSRAINFSDSIGNDLLQDISQVVADVKAGQEEDEANATAQREADEVHLRAQQQAGGFDGSLFDFANEAYVRMVYALRKLKDVGWICSPEEYETLALLAMEHLGIRERDVVSDFEAYEDKINACNEEEEDDSEGQDEGQDEDEDEEGGESNNKDTDNDDDDDSDEDANHKVGEENELSDEDTNVDDFSEHINDEAAMGLGHYHQDAEEDAIEESSAIIESLLDGKFAVDRLPAGVGEAIRTTPNAPGKLVMNTLVGVEGAADGAGSPHNKFEEGTMKLPPPPQTLKGRATSMVSQLSQRIVSKDLGSEHFIDRQGLGDKSNEYRVRPELKSQDLAIIDGGRVKTEPVTQGPAPLDGDAGPTDYRYPQGVDELDEAKEDQYAAHNENAADEYIDDDENPDQEFPDDEFRKRPNYKHHTYSRFGDNVYEVPGVRSDTEDLYGCYEDRKYSLMIGGFPVPNHATMENFTQKPPQYAYCVGENYAMMSGALPEGPDGKPDPGFEDHEHHAAGDKDAERIEGGEEVVQLRSFAAALDPSKVQPITGFSMPQTSFTGALIDESSSSESEDILPDYVDDNSELQHQESLNDGLPAYEAEEIRESKTPEEVESEESPHGHNALTTEDSIEDISTPQLETSNMEAAIARHGLADTKFPSLSVVPSTPPMKPTTDLGISSPFSTGMEVDDDDWSSKRLPTPFSRSSNEDYDLFFGPLAPLPRKTSAERKAAYPNSSDQKGKITFADTSMRPVFVACEKNTVSAPSMMRPKRTILPIKSANGKSSPPLGSFSTHTPSATPIYKNPWATATIPEKEWTSSPASSAKASSPPRLTRANSPRQPSTFTGSASPTLQAPPITPWTPSLPPSCGFSSSKNKFVQDTEAATAAYRTKSAEQAETIKTAKEAAAKIEKRAAIVRNLKAYQETQAAAKRAAADETEKFAKNKAAETPKITKKNENEASQTAASGMNRNQRRAAAQKKKKELLKQSRF